MEYLSYHLRPNEETEYSRMSRGVTGGMPGSSTTLLTGRGSTPTRPGGSHSSPRKGYGLVMSPKALGTEKSPMGPH
jgi:hypothetical protein